MASDTKDDSELNDSLPHGTKLEPALSNLESWPSGKALVLKTSDIRNRVQGFDSSTFRLKKE